MYEPTPLGYAIQDTSGSDQSNARQYDIDRAAFEKAGGRTVATSADSGDRDAQAVNSRVTIGELKVGAGRIRVAGALLPQPTEKFDHEFGLEPYATTYTGYVMARNLLESINRSPARGLRGTIGGRFVISGRRVKFHGKRIGVRVSCRTPLQCRGVLRLKVKVRRAHSKKTRQLTIGSRKFFYPTKFRNAVLPVTVSKKGRKLLRSKGRRFTRVYASAPVRFRDGLHGVARKSFKVYRP
jgi:hypothetical protein